MGANLILPFAQSGGANVLVQADYLADNHRLLGNQPGIARAPLVNKALLQASAIAVGLAQFLADNQTTDVTDDLLAAAMSTMIANAIKSAANNAGTIVWIAGTTALAQTLKINGALVTRAAYPRLWAHAQVSGNIAANDGAWVSGQYSPGDGATTFRVPDLRGYYLRAFDDGRGIDLARAIGTVQADQQLSHTHGLTDAGHAHGAVVSDVGHSHAATPTDPGHQHSLPVDLGGALNIQTLSDTPNSDEQATGSFTGVATTGITVAISNNGSGIGVTVNSGVTGITVNASSGGSEVRTKNIALMPVIFY